MLTLALSVSTSACDAFYVMSATKRTNRSLESGAKHPETFAEVVKYLRQSVAETQRDFGERFHHSRSYIANIERGAVYKPFLEQLLKEFSKHKTRIRAAYDVSVTQGRMNHQAPRTNHPIRRQVDALIKSGQFSAARRALAEGLRSAIEDTERQWMYDYLSVVLSALGKNDEAAEALTSAVRCAQAAELTKAEVTSRIRLARHEHHEGRFRDAHETLDAGLARFPDSSDLWLCKGTVHWYEAAHIAAYATLTVALAHGAKRSTILRVRGQVLAELHSFDAALADLNAYLDEYPDRIAVNEAAVRSARAYIWSQTGKTSEAGVEFDHASSLHCDSGWLYYRRALCAVALGDYKAASGAARRALECDNPRLWPVRRQTMEALSTRL